MSTNFIEGSKRLRGLGFGLTPSGDDFIAGALTALNLSQAIFEKDNLEKISQIYRAALGQNPLVNAFLRCAKAGQLTMRAKSLAQTILHEGRAEIYRQTIELLEMGETSGADWGVGFYMTMRAELGGAKD